MLRATVQVVQGPVSAVGFLTSVRGADTAGVGIGGVGALLAFAVSPDATMALAEYGRARSRLGAFVAFFGCNRANTRGHVELAHQDTTS